MNSAEFQVMIEHHPDCLKFECLLLVVGCWQLLLPERQLVLLLVQQLQAVELLPRLAVDPAAPCWQAEAAAAAVVPQLFF